MGPDVGKAVGGHCEESLPLTLCSHRGQGRQLGVKVRTQIACSCPGVLTTLLAGLYQTVPAAQEKSIIA